LFAEKKITFIGPGAMAEAMIAGIVKKGISTPETITGSGPIVQHGQYLTQKYGIQSTNENVAAVQDADVVVLSVKPQTLDAVLEELKGHIPAKTLVLSIIAGAKIQKISNGLDHKQVVRAMPNTLARVGRCISVWTASSISEEQHEIAGKVLSALGGEIFMEDEKYLDMATALSGTGPAYVFMFMEAMVDAGVHMGFPRRVAEELVLETVSGSVEYYKNSSETRTMHLARLRNEVTSPGGTTAAALYYLDKAGFRTAVSRAIWAAYERSVELGKDAKTHAPED
jgi:pyrroline-5-carboxylate reductase